MNDFKQVLGNKFYSWLAEYEKFLIAALVICLMLKSFHVPFSGIISVIVFTSTAVVYFFSAFSTNFATLFNTVDLLMLKLSSIASAVTSIGILYTIQHWPGSRIMLLVGSLTMLFPLVYMLIQNGRKPDAKPFGKWMIYRLFILDFIAFGFLVQKFSQI